MKTCSGGVKEIRLRYFTCWRARGASCRWQQGPRIRPRWGTAPFIPNKNQKDVALRLQFSLKKVHRHYIKKLRTTFFIIHVKMNINYIQLTVSQNFLSEGSATEILICFGPERRCLWSAALWDDLFVGQSTLPHPRLLPGPMVDLRSPYWHRVLKRANKQTIREFNTEATCHLWETFWDTYLQYQDYSRHQTEIQQLPLRWHVFSRPRSSAPRWIPSPKMAVKKNPKNIITPYTQ